MNDRPSRREDLALHVAAGKRSGEAEISAAAAAQWRRGLRAREILIPPLDEPDHAGQARAADYSAAPVLEGPRVEVRPDPPSASDPLSAPDPPSASDPLIGSGAAAAERPPRPPPGATWSGHRGLLLLAVVTIQIVLSLRLVWTNSAYIDEATYLWAGHLEVAHWLHGTGAGRC
jgi:hypothetical protein